MRKGRVFYRLFIPFFLLGIALVTGFSLFIYHSTYDSVEQNFLQEKKNYTKQILYNVEQKVRTIEYGFTTYSSTANFESIFTSPLSEKDFDSYRNIKEELSYIEMMGIEGSKYSLTSLSQKWGIVNGSLKRLTDQEVADFKNSYVNHNKNRLFWKPIDDGIRMVMTLPMYKSEKFALGMADIPKRSIDQIVGDQKMVVEIYNRQDELIYSSNKSKHSLSSRQYQQVKQTAQNHGQSAHVFLADNAKKYVFVQSDYNNWLYVSEIDDNEISGMIHNTRAGLFVASILLILLVGFVSYVLAQSFSRPIKKIQEKMDIKDVNLKRNELSVLAESVDQIVGQNELLTANLSKQKPQLETLFVLSLFRKRINENEVIPRLEQFGYHFKKEKVFYTALIQIDHSEEQQSVEKDLFLLAINNIVENLVPQHERLIPIVLNDEMQATIFIFDKDDQEAEHRIMKYCEEIQEAVKNSLKLEVSVGISPVYQSLIDSKKAVDLAKESLHYRVNVGAESVIFYKDIASMLNGASISKYPVELQNQLMSAVRSGDEEEATQMADLLVEEIFRSNKNPTSLGVALMRAVNELIQLGQLLGADPNIFRNAKGMYQEAMNAYYPEKIKGMLIQDLLKPVITSTQDKNEAGFKSLSEKITSIVENEFDKEISLEMIADRLHYSRSYLSNVFKREYGESFVDYLMNYRLEMAKHWLEETDMTIKEIAERLQYRNSQNFIRFFKKKEGMTPGDYRKEHRH